MSKIFGLTCELYLVLAKVVGGVLNVSGKVNDLFLCRYCFEAHQERASRYEPVNRKT